MVNGFSHAHKPLRVPNAHNPGGKQQFRLAHGVIGWCSYAGERMQYRPMLGRAWGGAARALEPENHPYLLSIGLNPSTAGHDVDDPTIRIETGLAKRLGYEVLIKTNLVDFRCTDPKELKPYQKDLISPENEEIVFRYAKGARTVLLTWGNVPRFLQSVEARMLARLRTVAIPLKCLGRTKSNSPRHPLRFKLPDELLEF